jgi:hypothetical protein
MDQTLRSANAAEVTAAFWVGNRIPGALYSNDDKWEDPPKAEMAFFSFYNREIRTHGSDDILGSSLLTFDHLKNLAADLKTATRDNAIRALKTKVDLTDEQLGFATNLAARLLITLEVGRLPKQPYPARCGEWTEGTLKNFATEVLTKTPELPENNDKLPRSFGAWSLEAIAGIRVQFTDQLSEHLQLSSGDTKIYIYHHASVLEHYCSMISNE